MLIYILYHDFESEKIAQSLNESWSDLYKVNFKSLRVGHTALMENEVFLKLIESIDEWKNEDYVGIVSYSVLKKMSEFSDKQIVDINWDNLKKYTFKDNYDVIGLYALDYYKGGYKISLQEGGTFQHGMKFIQSWESILKKCNYCREQIYDENILPFFCNWWIARPEFMLKYITFFLQILNISLHDDESRKLLLSNAFYTNQSYSKEQIKMIFNSEYYSLIPFVFERLPSFFFHHLGVKVGYMSKFTLTLF